VVLGHFSDVNLQDSGTGMKPLVFTVLQQQAQQQQHPGNEAPQS
jgi:hypothetical protein